MGPRESEPIPSTVRVASGRAKIYSGIARSKLANAREPESHGSSVTLSRNLKSGGRVTSATKSRVLSGAGPDEMHFTRPVKFVERAAKGRSAAFKPEKPKVVALEGVVEEIRPK